MLMVSLLLAALGLISPARTSAAQVDFSVNWTAGQLAGQTSDGWFTFNSGLIQPDARYSSTTLFDQIQLTVRGFTYTRSALESGWLAFDAAGGLQQFALGSDCTAGSCLSFLGNPASVFVTYNHASAAPGCCFFASIGDPGSGASAGFTGSAVMTVVNEPPVILLLGFGAVLLGLRRSRQHTRAA
jgi:hypothetical protein